MMELMLQAVIIIFMIFLCALCLFAVVVIVRDIIRETAAKERDTEENNATAKEPVQLVVQPVVSTPSVVQVPISVVEKPVEEAKTEEPETEEPKTEEPEVEPETEEVQYIRIKEQKLVKENDAMPKKA